MVRAGKKNKNLKRKIEYKGSKKETGFFVPVEELTPWVLELVEHCRAYLEDNSYDLRQFVQTATNNDRFALYCYNKSIEVKPHIVKELYNNTDDIVLDIKNIISNMTQTEIQPSDNKEAFHAALRIRPKSYLFDVFMLFKDTFEYLLRFIAYSLSKEEREKLISLFTRIIDLNPDEQEKEEFIRFSMNKGGIELAHIARILATISPLLSRYTIAVTQKNDDTQEHDSCSDCTADHHSDNELTTEEAMDESLPFVTEQSQEQIQNG